MAVYAIYAFCRQADDTVDADEPIAIKKEKLDQLEEALISFTDGQTADHPMWRALRDVGEDYRDNYRVYLPSDRLAAHDLYLDIIMKKGPDQAFITMWEEIAQESEAAYDSFIAAIDQFDSDCQLAVLTSANVYRGILDSVRAQNYDCINRRNYVSELKMVQLVLEIKKQLKKKK